jgi:hypothetical protein
MSNRRNGPRTGADGGSGPIRPGTPLHRLLAMIAREVAAPGPRRGDRLAQAGGRPGQSRRRNQSGRPTEGPGAE